MLNSATTMNEPRSHRHVWVLILAVVLYPVFALCGLRAMSMLTFDELMSTGSLILPWLYFLFVSFIAFVGLRLNWIHLVWFMCLMAGWACLFRYVLYEGMKSA